MVKTGVVTERIWKEVLVCSSQANPRLACAQAAVRTACARKVLREGVTEDLLRSEGYQRASASAESAFLSACSWAWVLNWRRAARSDSLYGTHTSPRASSKAM